MKATGVAFLYLMFAVALGGCATTAKYEAMLDTWRGDDVNNLIMSWGAPARQFKMPNGTDVYEYHYDGGMTATATVYGNDAYMNANSRVCTTSFFVKDAKVINWNWKGNACRSR